jgi:hypothetical protein
MFALLSRHFEGVEPGVFEADLLGKNWVILIRDGTGMLAGFSTLDVRNEEVGGAPCTVVYSGDTIVDPSAWSSAALPRAWIGAVRAVRPHDPARPLLWLLLTSGFRTYRLLSTFWREFVPGVSEPTAGGLVRRDVLNALAEQRFGGIFDRRTGIVRFSRPQRLRTHLAAVDASRQGDPHVRYFLAANPGHADGDELACLASLEDENLTRAGRRMVGLTEVPA